jgi:LmbE family N-acetylglucosaminyl deacetylase
MFEAWNMYMSNERPTGTPDKDTALLIRLEGRALDRKLTALRAMATQTAPLMQLLNTNTYAAQVAEEAFVNAATFAPSKCSALM